LEAGKLGGWEAELVMSCLAFQPPGLIAFQPPGYLAFQPPGFIAFKPSEAWRLGSLEAGKQNW